MKKILIASALTALFFNGAFAQQDVADQKENSSRTYIGLKLGYASSSLKIDALDGRFNTMGNGFGLSATLGFQKQRWENVGIRAEVEYKGGFGLDTDYNIDIQAGSTYFIGKDSFSNSYHAIMANLYLDFTNLWKHVKPYIGAGVGYVMLSRDVESSWSYSVPAMGTGTGSSSESTFSGGLGLGLYTGFLVPLNERLDLDFNIAYNISAMKVDYGTTKENESLGLFSVMAGVKYLF